MSFFDDDPPQRKFVNPDGEPLEYYGDLPELPRYDYSALADQTEPLPLKTQLQTLVIRPHDSDPEATVVHLGFGRRALVITYYQGDTVDFSFPDAIEGDE